MLENVKGELRIFTNKFKDRVLFSTCIASCKNEDEEDYTNFWVNVQFSKVAKKEVAKVYTNKSFDIVLADGWLKCFNKKDGSVGLELFANKITLVADETKSKAKAKTKAKPKKEETDEVDEDSLPF